jgi:hypothetical protein
MELTITPKQEQFINSSAFETLFGGAAGGGKSYGQLVDALIYASKYPKSKQVIFRRTFRQLEMSIVRTARALYPREIATYNESKHCYSFKNGSIIDFAYCDSESDVYQYQSAEYDVIRFDELTHFTEFMYVYLISRCRGANGYPKAIKSSTNPGGVGHTWVKKRFISLGTPNTVHSVKSESGRETTRQFIPSKVQDNSFLMESDPEYIARLETLPEKERRALLHGDWDIFEGQYFGEFNYEQHTCDPFAIPKEWKVYRAMDYGLDCFAMLWIACDDVGGVYVFREFAESDMTISAAAEKANELTDEVIYDTLAPPDLWNRSQETGRSKAILFEEAGLKINKSNNDREAGWLAVRELLKTNKDGFARLKVFRNCTRLINDLPQLQHDAKKPTDCATEPHDITHVPDALRYFAIAWTQPADRVEKAKVYTLPFALRTVEDEEDYEEDELGIDW